eukprot:12899579-Prorocentrum_lima.AAC.1
MHAILATAGAPQTALKLILQIIDICKTCRQFRLPSPGSEATSRLTTPFNHIVQHGILFVDSHVEQSAAGLPAAGAAVPPLQP